AIGGENAQAQAWRCRHHAIAFKAFAVFTTPGRKRVDDGTMDLGQADQPYVRRQRIRDPPAILGHRCRIVFRAGTAIERGVDALRDAALAGEEAMGDAGRVQTLRLETLHGGKPATSVMAGGISASTLKRRPIASWPISRSVAARRVRASSGLAFINCSARSVMPRLARNAPCVAGPDTEAPPRLPAAASAAKSTWAERSSSPGSASTSAKRCPPTACRVSAKPVRAS